MLTKYMLPAILLLAAPTVFAQGSSLYDPSIKHVPKDGIVKLYGAGGSHTAFRKVADVWQQQTGQRVEIIAGPVADGTGGCGYFVGHVRTIDDGVA